MKILMNGPCEGRCIQTVAYLLALAGPLAACEHNDCFELRASDKHRVACTGSGHDASAETHDDDSGTSETGTTADTDTGAPTATLTATLDTITATATLTDTVTATITDTVTATITDTADATGTGAETGTETSSDATGTGAETGTETSSDATSTGAETGTETSSDATSTGAETGAATTDETDGTDTRSGTDTDTTCEPDTLPAIDLGAASSFAVLGGSTVTNTGPSVLDGDLGVSPGTSIVGFPPGVVVPPYTTHVNDGSAVQAQADLAEAYDQAAIPAATIVATELGGQILDPGVYASRDGAFQLTGILTLDGGGDPNARWIFQTESTLITAPFASVVMIDAACASNVFWQIGSSATLATDTDFIGTIMALASITVNTGSTVEGRLLARNGAVTLDTNTVDILGDDVCCPSGVVTPVN